MSSGVLTEREITIVEERLEYLLLLVERSGLPERIKLETIGRLHDGIVTGLRDPSYGFSNRVEPSILPQHDDTTIGRMAHWQRKIRESGVPPGMQALQLERLEAYELFVQSQDRRPGPPPREEEECYVDVGEYDF